MSVVIDGTSGVTTPGVVNTVGETIATTLVVSGTTTLTGVTTLTGGLNAALPVSSGGTGVTTKTGTGAVVLGTSPTLVTPILGTPTSGVLDSCTGTNLAKAWVRFNASSGSSATITGSLNTSSVTYTSTGFFTVNFTSALTDANYSATGSCNGTASTQIACMPFTANDFTYSAPSSSAFTVLCSNYSTRQNPTAVCIAVFR